MSPPQHPLQCLLGQKNLDAFWPYEDQVTKMMPFKLQRVLTFKNIKTTASLHYGICVLKIHDWKQHSDRKGSCFLKVGHRGHIITLDKRQAWNWQDVQLKYVMIWEWVWGCWKVLKGSLKAVSSLVFAWSKPLLIRHRTNSPWSLHQCLGVSKRCGMTEHVSRYLDPMLLNGSKRNILI